MKTNPEERQELHELAAKSIEGDREALEKLIILIRDEIYNLALYMLWHPEDAKDATQEILIKVITNLSTFRFEAAFTTWVYRIASNYLITCRKKHAEQTSVSFDEFAEDLLDGLDSADKSNRPDQHLLEEEVKIGCTRGMLLCLDREHRLAYVLGEVFDLPGEMGGKILGISAAAYRKRLSRARNRVRTFMKGNCGLINPNAACRCSKRVTPAIKKGRVDSHNLLFTSPSLIHKSKSMAKQVREMEELHETAAIYRSQPSYEAPEILLEKIKALLKSDKFQILN